MRNLLLTSLFFLQVSGLTGQAIYIVTNTDAVYRLNLEDCTYDFVAQVNREAFDIAFHPDGSLYGISGNGNLYSIDTLTGNTTIIHDFGGQSFNSLTIGADGTLYTIGDDGELWTYDLLSSTANFLGDIQFNATGDLAFFEGNLYVAVTGDRIVRINLNNPGSSGVVINENIPGTILGIVSDVVECTDINLYAITNGLSDIYEVDLEDQSLQLVCQLNITVGGGASTTEFLGSSPLFLDSVTVLPANCNFEDGALSIHASGGFGELSYALLDSGFQQTSVILGLDTGQYYVVVMDAIGCMDTIMAQIPFPPSPEIDTLYTIPATCGNDDGQVEIVAFGGNSGLLFSLDSIQFTHIPLFENLGQGDYEVFVMDSSGCHTRAAFIIDTLPYALLTSIDVFPTSCGGSNGSLIAHISPSMEVEYALQSGAFQSDSIFSGLQAATYLVRIRDPQGCMDTISVDIPGGDSPVLVSTTIIPANCSRSDGQIGIGSVGGVPPYQYALGQMSFQADSIFSMLPAGTYSIIVIDAIGCIDSTMAVINESDPVSIVELMTDATPCGEASGAITILVLGGQPPYQFSLNGNTAQTEPHFDQLPQGAYLITIQDNAACMTEVMTRISAVGCNVYMPNIFSPNGDGINDVIRPYTPEPDLLILQFSIYDRWGNQVFLRQNMDALSNNLSWDGTFRNQDLMPGVFAYILKTQSADGSIYTLKGDITLLR